MKQGSSVPESKKAYCPPPDHPHLYRRGDVKNLFYPSRILAEGSRGEGQCPIFAPETSCDTSKKKVKLILINSLMHLIHLDVWSVA